MGGRSMPTLFRCASLKGELPATFVYRDELVAAIRDIHPRAPTHILIVPNKLIPTPRCDRADEALLGHMFVVAAQLAAAKALPKDGYSLIVNCNSHGGQRSITCTCTSSAGNP